MPIQKGDRVELTQDHRDMQMVWFKAGQLGTAAIISEAFPDKVIVNFDGYEEQRQRQAERIAKRGIGYALVPWVGVIPNELLKVIP